MGDMKTPDFDDLLAAFDIPDMVDPKAAIESGQVEHEAHIKKTKSTTSFPQSDLESSHDAGSRSVIVKNKTNLNKKGHFDSQSHSDVRENLDGFFSIPSICCDINQHKSRPANDNEATVISAFSPISSADEIDEEDNAKDGCDQKSESLSRSTNKQPDTHVQNNYSNVILPQETRQQEELKTIIKPEELNRINNGTHVQLSCLSDIAVVKDKTSDYLSQNSSQENTGSLSVCPQEVYSSETPKKKILLKIDNTQELPNTQEELLTKLHNSPLGLPTDEPSCTSSPVSIATDTVIPKVCITTIKTKTGQIKRKVSRVPSEQKKSGITIGKNLVGTTGAPTLTPSLPTPATATSGGFVKELPKQKKIKPVATAYLPLSAMKAVGSQVISLMLADNTTVKATVIPASSIPSTNIVKPANGIQPQAIMMPSSKAMNAKHLGNLNLVPKAVSCSQKLQSRLQLKSIFSEPKKSSQSSLVDAFNKVLTSINPVPVYVPNLSPPSTANLSLPSRGYMCVECGDSFALEKSLTQHCERRSVRIDVSCNHCDKSLVFYNKCSLLSHARSHKDKGVAMQCSNLILKPIPTDQMITTANPASLHNTRRDSDSKKTKQESQAVVLSSPCAALADDEASKLDRPNHKCWECSEVFEDANSLAAHYQQESSNQKTCSVCQMMLPNPCSFQSHQRIHQHKSPFVCPECGSSFQSVHVQANHVNRSCLHYSRRSGFRCVDCSTVLADASALKAHIQSSHCEVFYKCSICPMAFKSAPGTQTHVHTQHPGVKAGDPKLIHKCAMCDTVFTLQSLLFKHLEQHVHTHRVGVFKCPNCSMNYAHKQLMLDHIKATHGALKPAEGPPLILRTHGALKPAEGPPLILRTHGALKPAEGPPLILRTHGALRPAEGPPLILRASNSNLSKETEPSSEKKGSSDLQKDPESSEFVCAECNTSFSCRETYARHLRLKHGKVLKKHSCLHCDKCFSSVHGLYRHNRLKHKDKSLSFPQCPPLSQAFVQRLVLDPKTKNTSATETPPAQETISPKRKPEVSPDVSCRDFDSVPLKKLKVNIINLLKCSVCGFNTENTAVFREHIPRHKSDGSSYQCKECGLCYTSPRSLSRHMFIDHRLKEPRGHSCPRQSRGESHQRENQLSADENDDGAPNTRCKVCGRDFETEATLNSHMRTHGMAFIKAKARRLREEASTD